MVYFPLGDRLFEINYVEHEQPFYQLQKNYVYTLSLQLYRYDDEVIDTGVDTIDDEIEQIGYMQTLTLIGQAITATGTATTTTGGITIPVITNMGGGYATAPTVGFSSAPSGGVTAAGIASITNDFVGCDGTKGGSVNAILLSNVGSGYTVAPTIVMSGGGGDGATATTGLATNTSVSGITITAAGSGYIENPTITFSAPPTGGITATGVGRINSAGIVTAAFIVNPGSGYTTTPTLTFSAPPASVATGSYIFNEIVTGSSSGTTARVKEFDASANTLEVSIVDGAFLIGENIVGSESGASFAVRLVNKDDINDPFADNDNIEVEADAIIDFTKTNPFGMP